VSGNSEETERLELEIQVECADEGRGRGDGNRNKMLALETKLIYRKDWEIMMRQSVKNREMSV